MVNTGFSTSSSSVLEPSAATTNVAFFVSGVVGVVLATPTGLLPSKTGSLPALSANGLFGLLAYTVAPGITGLYSPGMLKFAVMVYVPGFSVPVDAASTVSLPPTYTKS